MWFWLVDPEYSEKTHMCIGRTWKLPTYQAYLIKPKYFTKIYSLFREKKVIIHKIVHLVLWWSIIQSNIVSFHVFLELVPRAEQMYKLQSSSYAFISINNEKQILSFLFGSSTTGQRHEKVLDILKLCFFRVFQPL